MRRRGGALLHLHQHGALLLARGELAVAQHGLEGRQQRQLARDALGRLAGSQIGRLVSIALRKNF